MTDPHLPFLRPIIARPDDDLPRLIYADWLGHWLGQARAWPLTGVPDAVRDAIPANDDLRSASRPV